MDFNRPFTKEESRTIVAGLALLKIKRSSLFGEVLDIATDDGRHELMGNVEIDMLCDLVQSKVER